MDADQIPSMVIGPGVDGGVVHGAVIVRVSVSEPVDHHEIKNLGFPVFPDQLGGVHDREAVHQGDSNFCAGSPIARGPEAHVRPAGSIGRRGNAHETGTVLAQQARGVELILPPGPDTGARSTGQPDVVHLVAPESDGRQLHFPFLAPDGHERVESAEAIVHPVRIDRIGHFLSVHNELVGMLAGPEDEINGPRAVLVPGQRVAGSGPSVEGAHDADVHVLLVVHGHRVGDALLGGREDGHVLTALNAADFQCTESVLRLPWNPDARSSVLFLNGQFNPVAPRRNPEDLMSGGSRAEIVQGDPRGVRGEAHGHGGSRNHGVRRGSGASFYGTAGGEDHGEGKKEKRQSHGGSRWKTPGCPPGAFTRSFQSGVGAPHSHMRMPRLLAGGGPTKVYPGLVMYQRTPFSRGSPV